MTHSPNTEKESISTTLPPPNGCTSKFLAAFYKPSKKQPLPIPANLNSSSSLQSSENHAFDQAVVTNNTIAEGSTANSFNRASNTLDNNFINNTQSNATLNSPDGSSNLINSNASNTDASMNANQNFNHANNQINHHLPFTMVKKGKVPKMASVPRWYSINPVEMGFIPRAHWKDETVQLAKLVNDHFRAKSTKMIRFEHKLWNALSITTRFPDTYGLVGVKWVTPNVIKVDRKKFGERMLCLTRPNASLFNPQGSFQSHGFEEVSAADAMHRLKIPQAEIADVDETKVRLYQHKTTKFTMLATPEQIEGCRWQAPAA
ncbi:hypothetical protein TRFO_05829 [Tritrichomonas foetus]|uniref:Initiator binding domain-containing protein n=1 Tax=Tritrichomonas foetus TaxID=1144522 RepID=A0A1J4K2M7_9EUKA|nr:hypothetical protein TRFO_05829 [Tritrichomonas foetus]|eukprot:OHT05689.1 hypothetical protein TRFO_05829 [Tritrichomonas foetus]